jgi:hypothetical protein
MTVEKMEVLPTENMMIFKWCLNMLTGHNAEVVNLQGKRWNLEDATGIHWMFFLRAKYVGMDFRNSEVLATIEACFPQVVATVFVFLWHLNNMKGLAKRFEVFV